MTFDELKNLLANCETVEKQPFELLKEMTRLFNGRSEDLCRDVVFRALEHRAAFGAALQKRRWSQLT